MKWYNFCQTRFLLIKQYELSEKATMNRKLIRPNISEYKEKMARDTAKKKTHPAYETHAENYYYLKQMNKKTPVAVLLTDGERVEGFIEWYDKDCIKLNRTDEPNLLIFKHAIKYLLKLEEKPEPRRARAQRSTKKKTSNSTRT
jgi:host factor-I protein